MDSKLRLTGLAPVLLLAGCVSNSALLQTQQVPLEDAIVASKRALVRSGERMVFEEFVKYKELGSTVALYSIGDVTLDTSVKTTITQSAENETKATLPGGSIGVKETASVSHDQDGKLEVKLKALGNSPETYKLVKEKFSKSTGRGGIYDLTSPHDTDPAKVAQCTTENYCFRLRDKAGSEVYAYLSHVDQFRALLDEIRMIAPPPEPESPPKKAGRAP